MLPLPLPDDLASVIAGSADHLATDMVAALGPDATLTERVEIERFVARIVTWTRDREPAVDERHDAMAAAALRTVAGWPAARAGAAAAWQLALAAYDLDRATATIPPIERRRALP